MGVASLVLLVGSLLLLPVVLGRMPADHFVRPPEHPRHAVLWVVRNAVGLVLLLAGIAMLVLPGQGILTIIAGLALADFPGKRRLEIALARRESILRMLNWLRARRGKGPFVPPG